MVGEWATVELEHLVEPDRGISYGIVQPGAPVDDGVPIVRVSDVRNGRITTTDPLRVSPTIEATYSRTRLKGGELLLTLVGTVGEAAVVPDSLAGWNTARAVAVIPVRKDIGSYWVKLALDSPVARQIIDTRLNTTVQATLNLRDVAQLPIVLPPPRERDAIVHILGTLDDKIELNRRINETLEAMARALFKSWFVDFDPVRAKAEGRNPGLPKPLADLFPGSFEDSDLGEIPKGWEVGKLGDVLGQRVERCVASAETAARPYVPIDCISPKSLFLTESKPGEEAQSSLTKFYKEDLLFGAMRPYFHKVCIAPFDGTTRTTAFVLYPKRNEDFAFAALLLHHPDTIDYATRHSTGSTIPYAVWSSSLEDMPAIVPPSEVRNAFDGVVRLLLTRIPEPYFQNKTLAGLRDTLLPKLISGELRVKDVEYIIGVRA